jgi:ketosteroid isomerase-like protein
VSEPSDSENLRLAKRFFELWNAGVREIDEDLTDPEIELHTPISSTRGTPYRGYDGVRQWLSDIGDQFEQWSGNVDEFLDLGDGRVLCLGQLHLRGRGSGVEFDQEMAWLLTLRDGRYLRYEVFTGHEEGRRAAGLQP